VSDVPELPKYPTPQERKPVTIPSGIPNTPHPKQSAPLQKLIGKMFKGPQTKTGRKSKHGTKKNKVVFY
jgi:hypothetical protein